MRRDGRVAPGGRRGFLALAVAAALAALSRAFTGGARRGGRARGFKGFRSVRPLGDDVPNGPADWAG